MEPFIVGARFYTFIKKPHAILTATVSNRIVMSVQLIK